jgi:hypothetical protein
MLKPKCFKWQHGRLPRHFGLGMRFFVKRYCNPMNFVRSIALVPFLWSFAVWAQSQSPRDLVKDVVYNEQQDRLQDSFWQYRVEKQIGEGPDTVSQQVETKDGPIYKLLAYGTMPLNTEQRRQENERLEDFLHSPSKQAKVKQQREDDEKRISRLLVLMPDAFLYEYDGQEGDLVRLKFRPNPQYNSPTTESRVFHALAGTVWINLSQKRLSHFSGTITDRVDFGYGLLGHLDPGGTLELRREPVNATHWKTALINVHLSGKVIFFKSVSKEQREERSKFEPVAANITMPQAKSLLDQVSP